MTHNEYSRYMLGIKPLVSISDRRLMGMKYSSLLLCLPAKRSLAVSTSRMVKPSFSRKTRRFRPADIILVAPFLLNHLHSKIRLPKLCFLRKPPHQLTPKLLTAYAEVNPSCSEFVTECVYFEQI